MIPLDGPFCVVSRLKPTGGPVRKSLVQVCSNRGKRPKDQTELGGLGPVQSYPFGFKGKPPGNLWVFPLPPGKPVKRHFAPVPLLQKDEPPARTAKQP